MMGDKVGIYLVGDGTGRVKIGYAADVDKRMAELQTGNSSTLEVLRWIDGGLKGEAWFHRRFAEHRISGEWFWLVDEMLTIQPPDEIPVARVRNDYESRYERNEISAEERREKRLERENFLKEIDALKTRLS